MAKKLIGRPRMPLTATQFEKELATLERLYNRTIITAREHKKLYDELVKRFKEGK
jgi:hypothetical protein